jgi:hypothetical protein
VTSDNEETVHIPRDTFRAAMQLLVGDLWQNAMRIDIGPYMPEADSQDLPVAGRRFAWRARVHLTYDTINPATHKIISIPIALTLPDDQITAASGGWCAPTSSGQTP